MAGRPRLAFLFFAATAVTALVAVGIRAMSNPLRQSNDAVSAWLLAQTPRGSSINEVRQFLDGRAWNEDAYHKTLPPPAAEPFMGGTIGSYNDLHSLPYTTFVRAFWEFDSKGRLIGIRVDRWVDSP